MPNRFNFNKIGCAYQNIFGLCPKEKRVFMSDVQTEPVENQPAPKPQDEASNIPSGFVSQDVFERTKKDMFKYKQDAENAKKLMDEQRLQRLKETQNWEAIAKEKEQEAVEERNRRQTLESSIVQHQKFMALKNEALKQNMHPNSLDDLELLDLPEVSVETTSTGKILVTGADRAIANLKTLRPHWFKQNAPSINPATPETIQTNQSSITIADLAKLEAEYKKNPTQANKQAYFLAIQKFKNK